MTRLAPGRLGVIGPRGLGLLAAAWAAFAMAAPGFAQPAPEPAAEDDNQIVVTGRPGEPTRAEVFDQARELSRVGRYDMSEVALPRFEAPLCPGVFGLRADYAEQIVERIRANAERVDVRLARGRCSPNLIVAFVDDGQSLLTGLERKHPRLFELVAESERTEIFTDQTPVRVWNNIETRWADGRPVPRRRGREVLPSARGQVNRMMLPTRRDIVSALVVFDREAVLGMTLVELADYATMRGLSHTRPASGDERMATILATFDPDRTGPGELTGFDLGYLRSLYWWEPNLSATTKLLGVRRRAADAEQQGE